jgi:hypothetical protein
VEFELVVEMNLVQIGTNEFFPQLIRLAANERHLQSRARTATRNWRAAINVPRLLNPSCPSRGDPFPPILVMEAAENCVSHDLAVSGEGMSVVTLRRQEYRGTFRNPRSEAQMRAPLVVMSTPLRQDSAQMFFA